MPSYAVHVAVAKDIKNLSPADQWRQPQKMLFGGTDNLEQAKAMAETACAEVAKQHPHAVAYVTDMSDPYDLDKFETRVYMTGADK